MIGVFILEVHDKNKSACGGEKIEFPQKFSF